MSNNKPFFSNFIETQVEVLTEQEMQECAGGSIGEIGLPIDEKLPPVVTMKAPSDDDEGFDFLPFEF